jgi:hypothetical protein
LPIAGVQSPVTSNCDRNSRTKPLQEEKAPASALREILAERVYLIKQTQMRRADRRAGL